VIEDALLRPIKANPGINIRDDQWVKFADMEHAEVHSGFAYATMSLLFDDNYGLLTRLLDRNLIPNGSDLYIVGHSQGAAMATLLH
jgi:hypothetical protein